MGEGVEAAVTVRFPAENPHVKDQDIAEFWNWFASNADRLRKGGESNAAEFGKRLASLDPDLCWEMGGAKDEPWDLSIRSEDAEHRAMAFRVVEAAPALRDWLVSPFRQPGSTDMRLEWQDGTIWDLEEFTANLSAANDGPFLNLALHHPKFGRMKEEDRVGPGFTALDTALGEELMEDAVDDARFKSGKPGAIPLGSLRETVRARLAELRAEANAGDDQWVLLEAREKGKPLIVSVAEHLDLRRVGHLPWLVEVSVKVRRPNAKGMPEGPEFDRIRDLDVPISKALRADRPVLFWGTETGRGRRIFRFFAPGPVTGLAETARLALAKEEVEGEVSVRWDARWNAWRAFLPR